MLLAQAVGRLGNWFNQELFGRPTTLPWGLEIDERSANFPPDQQPGTLFHPTFLYELLWNLAGVAILLLLARKLQLRGGRMFWLYAAYYTLGRVWIEALRIDDAEQVPLFGITQRLNVWTSIGVFLVALAFLIHLAVRRRPAGVPSVYLPGRGPEDDVEKAAGGPAGVAGRSADGAPAGSSASDAVPGGRHNSADSSGTHGSRPGSRDAAPVSSVVAGSRSRRPRPRRPLHEEPD